MNPRFVWSFAKFNGISWLHKSRPHLVSSLITPLCLVFIISVLSGGRLLPFAIVGGVIAVISANSLLIIGESAMFRLEYQIQDMIVATKASKIDYMLGLGISELVYSLPGIILFTIFSVVIGIFTMERFAITIAVIIMLNIATTSIAFLAGSKVKRTINMWAISGIFSSLMTLLPPTFYPYTSLPQPILYVLSIFPATPAAIVLQGAYGLSPVNLYAFALLIVEVIVYMCMVQKFAGWRMK